MDFDFGFAALLFAVILTFISARAAIVHETPTEFLTSGDFNGDGSLDALVLDKATGNARVGYQGVDGGLSWSAPFTNGIAGVTGVGIGKFIVTNRDAIAVTSPDFNRIALMNVPIPGSNSPAAIILPGPQMPTNGLIAAGDFAGLPATTISTATPGLLSANVGSAVLDISAFGLGTPQGTNPERTSFSGTTLNTFPGSLDGNPGTALALANSSANGKSAIFSFSMTGYRDLVVSFATRGTSTGFNLGVWAWSTDGINFTTLAGVNTASTNTLFGIATVNFSNAPALNDAATVYLRYTLSGATSASGNNRLDNIQLNATPTGPGGIGLHGLAGLPAPYGTNALFHHLLCTSFQNPDPSERLRLLTLNAGNVLSAKEHFSTLLERINPLRITSNVTYAVGMARGTNDALHVWRFTNSPASAFVSSNLPAGSEYTFGNFYLEPWPRFITYVPGESNLTVLALEDLDTSPRFGTPQLFAFNKPIHGVFYSDIGTNGQLWIQFGDGILGARPPQSSGSIVSNFWYDTSTSGNMPSGIIDIGINKAALLFSVSNSGLTDFAKTFSFNGSAWSENGSNALPTVTTRLTRANVWLFSSEPFVNPDPGFVASMNAPDWSRSVTGLPGALTAGVESDGGATNGLGNPSNFGLGTPPAGSTFGTPNQYHPAISLFSYSGATPPEPVIVAISPPPGIYGGPISISFIKQNSSHSVRYRLSSASQWLTYSTPFQLTNDATIQFYGEYATNNLRGRLQTATYALGRSNLPPAPTLTLPGSETNPPPALNTNILQISSSGTVFYGRRSPPGAMNGFTGPWGYSSFADSQFNRTNGMTYFYTENFEDGALNTPGATPSAGWVVAAPGAFTDSVDGDDGTINGSGAGGRSYYSGGGQTSLTITFNAAALGGKLPTHAAIVWTDVGVVSSGSTGFGNVAFSARDANGVLIGTQTGLNLGDGVGNSTTAEDRFFGVAHAGGISSISITMTNSVDWEIDHLQYGRLDSVGFSGSLWAINLDGSGETFVTTGLRPRVSRDGRYLSFSRENDPAPNQFSLWVRDLATGAEVRLHSSSNAYVGHDWTADNTGIIFDNNCYFWRIGLTGSATQLPLASDCFQIAPSVNPLDGRIAFHVRPPANFGLWLAPSNATSRQILNLGVFSPRWPSWSADGQRLVIADNPILSPAFNDAYNLFVVKFGAQTNVYQITAFPGYTNRFPYGAVWTPNGNKLVAAGQINAVNGLWAIPLAADGSACHCPPQLLPTSPGDDIDFAGGVVTRSASVSYANLGLFIRMAANGIVVYWNTNYDGFVLESALEMPAGFSWSPVSGPYFRNGPWFEYHESHATLAARKYFRLAYPGVLVLTPSEPQLDFRIESNAAVLNWPFNYVGYTLEAATNLSPPVFWSPLGGPYPNTNGMFEFRRTLPGPPQEFYRLRGP